MNTRQDYINELKEIRPALELFTALPEDTVMSFTDEELGMFEKLNARAEFACAVLEGIAGASQTTPGTDAQQMTAQKSDPDSTLALLNDVARHLSGRDVEVRTERLGYRGCAGLCVWNPPDSSHAIKISLDPYAIPPGTDLLRVFLHEVAHAKDPARATKTERFEGQIELEADGLGNKWQQYANSHAHKFRNNGGGNEANDLQRAKLLALLYSDDAPGWTVTV